MSLFTDLKEVFTAYASRIKNLGNQISEVNESLDNVQADLGNLSELETEANTDLVSAINEAARTDFSDEAKEALLTCLEKIALWVEGDRNEYIDELHDALYGLKLKPLRDANVVWNYYYNDSGEEIAASSNYILTNFYKIEEGKDYYWIKGFNLYTKTESEKTVLKTDNSTYRICWYDENKDLLSRDVSPFHEAHDGNVDPFSNMKLIVPEGAKFFRLSGSWNLGELRNNLSKNLYLVHIVLAKSDDSDISTSEINELVNKVRVLRNGTDITFEAFTGSSKYSNEVNIINGWGFGVATFIDTTSYDYLWVAYRKNRVINYHSYILHEGDEIVFTNVKAGVITKNIKTGSFSNMSAWINGDATYVVGTGVI